MKYLVFDYETRSASDLKKVGTYVYAAHPSTEVICVAWRCGSREELKTAGTKVWSPFIQNGQGYGELVRALLDPEVCLVAHNAFFEKCITMLTLPRIIHRPGIASISPTRWVCTAAMASALALPRSLGEAGAALGLPVQKDLDGRKLMLKMCKPDNLGGWRQDPKDLLRLMQYCAQDTDTEVELFLALPELSPGERKIWLLDQEINMRGFAVDRDLCGKVLKMIESETTRLVDETRDLTLGVVGSCTQRDATLEWLASKGVRLPDLRKKTVDDAIKSGTLLDDDLRLLDIRAAISKSSTAKYQSFWEHSQVDGRIRGSMLYHGASTGRWSGAGVQPQNLPRPKLKQDAIDLAIKIIKEEI